MDIVAKGHIVAKGQVVLLLCCENRQADSWSLNCRQRGSMWNLYCDILSYALALFRYSFTYKEDNVSRSHDTLYHCRHYLHYRSLPPFVRTASENLTKYFECIGTPSSSHQQKISELKMHRRRWQEVDLRPEINEF